MGSRRRVQQGLRERQIYPCRRAEALQRLLALASPRQLGAERRQECEAFSVHRVGRGHVRVVERLQLRVAAEE